MRLIDADAFCEKWKEVRKSEYLDDFARGYQAGIFAMDAAPTVDAEPVKHGRWIDEGKDPIDPESGNHMYLCPFCGHRDQHSAGIRVPRCWFCGAKMDGGCEDAKI